MSRKNPFSFILGLLLSFSLPGLVVASSPNAGQQSPERQETTQSPAQEIQVTVLVYNYAHLSKQILSDAQDRASLIFRKAGVEVEWADCPLKDEDPSAYPGCPELSDTRQLFLRIFPQTATRVDHGGESFVAARIANIFWSGIEERARRLNVSPPRFLAHIVAHELGHLLLGSNSHSPAGIMTARWNTPTVNRIFQDGLYFNRQQSELIRSELEKRKTQPRIFQNALLATQ